MRAPVEEKPGEKLPEGIQVEPSGSGAIFRWRVLPGSPGLIIFFAALALLVLSLGRVSASIDPFKTIPNRKCPIFGFA